MSIILILIMFSINGCSKNEVGTQQQDPQGETLDSIAITDPEVLNFNYSIGTQTIGPSYSFGSSNKLIASAEAIEAMGSNLLKISFNPDKYGLEANSASTLVEVARDNPSFEQVLDMDFNYYFFWVRSNALWKDGYSEAERSNDSIQIKDLTSYLLTKFNNTGKQFFLGHWEGDWYLLDNYDTDSDASQESIDNMIKWYSTRQNAVDEAIASTPHENVSVYHYAEVNRVRDALIDGKKRVINEVIPHVNVDYVSYSSYDVQRLGQTDYSETLNYIEQQLSPKPTIEGKRVFIGEMGLNATTQTSTGSEHEMRNREILKKALVWGVPFVLYWEMYSNLDGNGNQHGFWLIDNTNFKTPLYHTFSDFYSNAKTWVSDQKELNGVVPGREAFLTWALNELE